MRLESLLRLISVRSLTTHPQFVGSGETGPDAIRRADALAALGMSLGHERAHCVIAALLRADERQIDAAQYRQLRRSLCAYMTMYALSGRRRISDAKLPEIVNACVDSALAEHREDCVCEKCNGSGIVKVLIKDEGIMDAQCEHCRGVGQVRWSMRKIARSQGLADHHLSSARTELHDAAVGTLSGWSAEGAEIVARTLGV